MLSTEWFSAQLFCGGAGKVDREKRTARDEDQSAEKIEKIRHGNKGYSGGWPMCSNAGVVCRRK